MITSFHLFMIFCIVLFIIPMLMGFKGMDNRLG